MENKNISRKRLNIYKKKHLSKKKRLQYETIIMIKCCYLNIYDPLSRNFHNITVWLNLTFVNISSSMITILPSAFGKLRLFILYLSNNYLGTFNSTEWPWIEQNAIRNTLRNLSISNNSLTKLPFNIGRLNVLITLNISHNMLRSLPQSIGNLQKLNFLYLSHNMLRSLPQSIGNLQKLIRLNLSHNMLRSLPQSIGNLQKLNFLNLSHNTLRSLPQSIGNLQKLLSLNLSHNKLLYLPITMLLLKELSCLDISENLLRTQEYEQNNEQSNEQNNEQTNEQVQRLDILSANIVLQHSIPYNAALPPALIEFLEKAESCSVCKCIRMDLLPEYEAHSIFKLANSVTYRDIYPPKSYIVQFEGYYCPFCC